MHGETMEKRSGPVKPKKSERQMPKPERIPKSKALTGCSRPHLLSTSFGFRASGFFRHSTFGIRISSGLQTWRKFVDAMKDEMVFDKHDA
jgi:hypothetical protein